jgi:hypothetical protein
VGAGSNLAALGLLFTWTRGTSVIFSHFKMFGEFEDNRNINKFYFRRQYEGARDFWPLVISFIIFSQTSDYPISAM